jgi:hypothetical protein
VGLLKGANRADSLETELLQLSRNTSAALGFFLLGIGSMELGIFKILTSYGKF